MMTRERRDAAVAIMKAVAARVGDPDRPYLPPACDAESISVYRVGSTRTDYLNRGNSEFSVRPVRTPKTPVERLLDGDHPRPKVILAEIAPEIENRCGFDLFGAMALVRASLPPGSKGAGDTITVVGRSLGSGFYCGFEAPDFRDLMRDVFDAETLDCLWAAYFGHAGPEWVTVTPAVTAAAEYGAPFKHPAQSGELILAIAENVVANDGLFVPPPVPAVVEVA